MSPLIDFVFYDEEEAAAKDEGRILHSSVRRFRMHSSADMYKLLHTYAQSKKSSFADLIVIVPTRQGWIRLSGNDTEHKDRPPIIPLDFSFSFAVHEFSNRVLPIELLCPKSDNSLTSDFCMHWFSRHTLNPLRPDFPPSEPPRTSYAEYDDDILLDDLWNNDAFFWNIAAFMHALNNSDDDDDDDQDDNDDSLVHSYTDHHFAQDMVEDDDEVEEEEEDDDDVLKHHEHDLLYDLFHSYGDLRHPCADYVLNDVEHDTNEDAGSDENDDKGEKNNDDDHKVEEKIYPGHCHYLLADRGIHNVESHINESAHDDVDPGNIPFVRKFNELNISVDD
eukprot:CAMPEP_0197295850 /NCGR_PEP_ID=MMETSP0890-20130614/36689_1 /TAXON_ID=44058 ORGANISM="Aureoumbra lagunensis, Strain CCMP1510" /NCGR_SAMPLE_ID=MMETSP0890 /ASSEMBLY_ACC=CAM_ASM_000533 /LENGTH=334 /DNA_ID=CAMNT_0042772071 /DNA_START=290 /DNA_END=1297 /DNA_ORIENTATION=+